MLFARGRQTMTPAELTELADRIAETIAQKLLQRPRLLDRHEMALMANVSVATLDRRTRCGEWPSIKDGSRRLYDPADVIRVMKGGGADV